MTYSIRPVERADIDGIKTVLEFCELFPSEYLDEMIADYFNNPETEERWFTCINENKPSAIGYCVPEKFTSGTYNLLAIGVAKCDQRKGIANAMMTYIEQVLKSKDARILIVETSSDSAQEGARKLYNKLGYSQEATIREFWNEGEDKIVFWKKL